MGAARCLLWPCNSCWKSGCLRAIVFKLKQSVGNELLTFVFSDWDETAWQGCVWLQATRYSRVLGSALRLRKRTFAEDQADRESQRASEPQPIQHLMRPSATAHMLCRQVWCHHAARLPSPQCRCRASGRKFRAFSSASTTREAGVALHNAGGLLFGRCQGQPHLGTWLASPYLSRGFRCTFVPICSSLYAPICRLQVFSHCGELACLQVYNSDYGTEERHCGAAKRGQGATTYGLLHVFCKWHGFCSVTL